MNRDSYIVKIFINLLNFYPVTEVYTFLFLSKSERLILKNLLAPLNIPYLFIKTGLLNAINIPKKFLDNSGFFLLIFLENSKNKEKEFTTLIEKNLSGYLNFFLVNSYISKVCSFDIYSVIRFFVFKNMSLFKNLIFLNMTFLIRK
jgi:hypothetical protein